MGYRQRIALRFGLPAKLCSEVFLLMHATHNHAEISCGATLNLACKNLQARLGLAYTFREAAEAGGIFETVAQHSFEYAGRMNFVLQDSQGNQEEYIQYLKILVHELVKHHSHDHENCHFLPSARLSTNRTALVATQVSEISKRRQKRGFDNGGESTEGLRFISWQPSNQPPKPRDTGTKSWMPLAKKLVDLTPLAADWCKEARSFNLETIMKGGMAAQFVLDGSTKTLSIPRRKETEVSYNYGTKEYWLLSVAKGYAETTANRALTMECVLMLVNFQKFIVLCICAILSQMGASKPALVDITRICFGDVSKEYTLRL